MFYKMRFGLFLITDTFEMSEIRAGIRYNYVTGCITNGSSKVYGNGSGQRGGYIGVGEMWANYIEYRAMNLYLAPNGAVSLGGTTRWFKPQIIERLVSVYGFTQQQIFNCLTSDVNTHIKLRNKIISNYGQATNVTESFASYAFQ